MLCRLVFPAVLWMSMADGLLFKPRSKCVPTAAVQGLCHECICSTQGVYHCWHKKCDKNETETTDYDRECEPSLTYIEKAMICSCSVTGDWRSTNCRNRFRRIQTKNALTKQILRTNIACTPSMLYLIDCNICRCEANGIFKASSCTSRPCSAVHKAQTCKPGDIERFGNELCACSDINYFIDRLCFPINENEVQIVENENLEKLVHADQPWRRSFVDNYRCNRNITFTMDCNTCACKNNILECTNTVCGTGKNIGRSNSAKILPELKSADQHCKPGKKYKFKCNTCVCADDGLPTCTTNLTNIARTLPEIHGDEKCVPGQKYKMDCNTCFCKNHGSLICTKVLCLPPKEIDGRKKNDAVSTLNMKKKSTPRQEKKKLYQIPKLPKKNCIPGKIYKKGCQVCFCEDNKRAMCMKNKNICKRFTDPQGFKIYQLEDIRPRFLPGEVENLPELPQRHFKCQPGKSYKVDCNACICLASHNLICDDLVCLSYDEMHRIEADGKSKASCKPKTYNKIKENCIECDCVNKKVKCNEIAGCISEKDKKLPNWNNGKPKLTLDMYKDTCIPGGVYRKDCNNCYCQDDSTLRCTLKICYNYSMTKELEKIHSHITEHDL